MILAQLELASAPATPEILWNGDRAIDCRQLHFGNSTAGNIAIRVWFVKADETLANKHRYVYDLPVYANDEVSFEFEEGVCPLALSDKIHVYAAATGISATLLGI